MSRPIVTVGGPSPAGPSELGRYAQRIATIRPLTTGERAEIWTFADDGIAIVAVPYRGRSAVAGRVVFAGTGYRQGAGGGGDLRTAEDAFTFGSHWADEPAARAADAGLIVDRAWWGSALADAAADAILDAADRVRL